MAKMAEKEILDLIGQLYETAAQDSSDGWQEVFERLSTLISSGPGSLHFYIKRNEQFATIADTNPPGFVNDFNSIYFPILPFRDVLTTLKPGKVYDRTRELSDELFVPTELYQDHFRKIGIYHVVHASLMDTDAAMAGITFTRPENMREFEKIELEVFEFILPHLQRAMQMHVRLLESDGRQKVFEDAWDRVPQGVILVAESARVSFRNKAAEYFFGKGKPLGVDKQGRICTSDRKQTAAIHALINSVFNPGAENGLSYGGSVQVGGGNGSKPITLMVSPFTDSYGTSGLFERLAMIYIADPVDLDSTIESDLHELYGLTPAEARLAMLLAQGHSIVEIAATLGITPNTARTHLKRIFGKTETNRQGSLVNLILTNHRHL
jgi:DNA-binding CsgD family transcriptional regulator